MERLRKRKTLIRTAFNYNFLRLSKPSIHFLLLHLRTEDAYFVQITNFRTKTSERKANELSAGVKFKVS